MFEDALELESGDSTQSSMFPFLSVLFCTIGALMIIMIMGSMRTTLKNTGILAKVATAQQRKVDLAGLVEREESLLARVDKARDDISSAEKTIARGSRETRKASARLSDLRPESQRARSRAAKVGLVRKKEGARIARRDLASTKEATAKQIAETERRINELKATAADLTTERDDLQVKTKSPKVRFRLADEDSGRTPFYLELVGRSLVVRSEGTTKKPGEKIRVAEAVAAGGYLERLAAELARPGGSRYAMLLVRPETADLFHAATDCLRRLRAPFAYEPVDTGWRLGSEKIEPNTP